MFVYVYGCMVFFFFKQKTAYEMRISDWSSDGCSSDLRGPSAAAADRRAAFYRRRTAIARRDGRLRSAWRQGIVAIPALEGADTALRIWVSPCCPSRIARRLLSRA